MKWFRNTLFLATVIFAMSANSGERFDANVMAKTNSGKDKNYRFSFEFNDVQGESVNATMFVWDATHCGRERIMTGTLSATGVLNLTSDLSEMKGCGRLVFNGKKEDANTITGQMQFQGGLRDFVFKK